VASTPAPHDATLLDALGESQRLGMLGQRPLAEVVAHARHFVRAVSDVTGPVVDLGSGGGVPGLVLAWDRPDLDVTLLDRRSKRTDLLVRLVGRLQMSDRVRVVTGDARVLAGTAPHRHAYAAVTCRGVGPPSTTLQLAAGLVAPHGVIVISEPPPGTPDRWETALVSELGLVRAPQVEPSVVVFRVGNDATATCST
jgi:16S rRNA (guanine527-N7)-methyltransferase